MSRVRAVAGATLALLIVVGAAPAVGHAQVDGRQRRASSSYDRSYQLGYDEGYRKGYDRGVESRQDGKSNSPTDYKEYRRGDDGYNDSIGSREDYKLGYRAGFEQGIQDGYAGDQYGARPGVGRATVPPRADRSQGGRPVLKRGDDGALPPDAGQYPDPDAGQYPDPGAAQGPGSYDPNAGAGYPAGAPGGRIGYDTTLVIELETPITTKYSQEGDRFSARVLEPSAYAGARVEGYVAKITRPGKLKGKGEIVLEFEQMIFPDGVAEPMQAQVEEVLGYPRGTPRPGNRRPLGRAPWDWGKGKDDRNDDIDAQAGDEGQIEGDGSTNRDAAVVGGGAAVGAVIGGVVGGVGGAAAGAAIGAATGGGVVAGTRGHDIDLEPGAQLRIRTGQGVSH